MTSATTPENRASPEALVQNYGDLLFDLCESVLWSPAGAQVVFRSIVKEIKKKRSSNPFENYERAWVLKIACDRLRAFAQRHARRLTSAELSQLDATPTVATRLKQFDSFFHRLGTDDQIVLLLRDKYGIPYPEIAAAMQIPEGTLKTRRQQSLRALEEWLWETP